METLEQINLTRSTDMITKNAAARDVYWDVHVDPSALPDDYVAAWRLRFTWGQNYDHGASPAL